MTGDVGKWGKGWARMITILEGPGKLSQIHQIVSGDCRSARGWFFSRGGAGRLEGRLIGLPGVAGLGRRVATMWLLSLPISENWERDWEQK